MSREDYIAECAEKVKQFREFFKPLVKFTRDKKRNKNGVLIAYKNDGTVFFGWSKVHTPLDKFDKNIGLRRAIDASRGVYKPIPKSILTEAKVFQERALAYFKDATAFINSYKTDIS